MSDVVDIETLASAVETLWYGLAEETRGCFSRVCVEESAHSEPGTMVSSRAVAGSSPVMIVHHGSVLRECRRHPDLVWRSELARQMRRANARCIEAEPPQPGPEPSVYDEADDGQERESRMTFERFSAAIDGWSGDSSPPARSSAPPVVPASSVEPPATRASTPEWSSPPRSSDSENAISSAKGSRWRLLNPISWILAPARAAFRRRKAHGASVVALWAWRVGVIALYLTTIGGVVYLATTGVTRWGAAGDAASTQRDDAASTSLASRPDAVEVVDVDGVIWVVPRGWTVETEGGEIRWSGPNGALIEMLPLDEIPDEPRARARLCAGDRRAYASVGGAGLEYFDVRDERSTGWWLTRCVFDSGALIRASAPRLTFLQESLGEWLLLATLDHEWSGQGGGTGG